MRVFLSELRLYVCNHLVSKIPSHRMRLLYYRNIMKFKIEQNSTVFLGCKFDSTENLIIGKNSVINSNCRIDTRDLVNIGEGVSISSEVIILTASHDVNDEMAGFTKPVIIEDYVWIGTRAMILPSVTIREGAVVAAGAVVTNDVEANTIVGGVPASIIRLKPHSRKNHSAAYKRLFQ